MGTRTRNKPWIRTDHRLQVCLSPQEVKMVEEIRRLMQGSDISTERPTVSAALRHSVRVAYRVAVGDKTK